MTAETAVETDVRLAMEGDAEAYRRLIEASAGVVCSIALAMVRNVPASEDVAQEVFLAVWTQVRKLRNPASYFPWIRQITRNQAHVWIREHRREIANTDVLARAADPRPGADQAQLREEEHRILAEVLDELPDESREVVVLYYREDNSTRRVAELIGMSEEAVRQRLSRARSKIRDEMLHRFGGALIRSAPGAAFTTVVWSAVTTNAPSASAAVAATGKAVGGKAFSSLAILGKGMVPGALAGVAGILMGFTHLDPPFDDQEERALRAFRIIAIWVVLLFNAAFAAAVLLGAGRSVLLPIFVGYVGTVLVLYLGWLRRILTRRLEWERTVNPSGANDGLFKQALAPALGGASLMLSLYLMFR
jgi:RNA polymerase sigma factor (sigma-70 family)